MKWFFILLVVIHALIHLLGFLKAFHIAEINQLTQNISKPMGILWLIALILFLAAAIQLIINHNLWWITGIMGVILSQVLIILFWQDAKFGTIPNIIILIAVILAAANYFLKLEYINAVDNNFKHNNPRTNEILSEVDIQHLPLIVQKYIRYTGSVGKEKVYNFKAEFSGGIRSNPDEEYMQLKSVQYNFMENPARLFYIEAKKMGIPAVGIHIYQNEKAIFKIKLLSLFTVVDASGEKMDKGETVTVFNDMCFMVPATLIDNRITWESIDDLTVKAIFTNGKIKISAILYFNEKGELVNFISNDRYETDGKTYKNYAWSTPVKSYTDINGYRLPASADLIYSRPDGEFTYGQFQLKDIKYNCSERE
ncbi:MAG: hypothetical protein N3D80_08790 [Ignavibacterium album]|jgi:hypothetical protein|uniref:DUF6544 family protein n=1 Tax=Ignavibacterium album TaxID=591197 RepID=UPI0026E9C55D|nr:DUF6544 family protein [Ignavibacterium album]MCX8105950.1 hypothetical protein [Ignavibacterium album]